MYIYPLTYLPEVSRVVNVKQENRTGQTVNVMEDIMKKIVRLMAAIVTLAMITGAAGCSNSAKDAFDKETTAAAQTTAAATTAAPADDTTASTAAADVGTKDATKLVMGTNAAFPPFEYVEGGAISGVDADLMAAIAAKLGLTLEIVDMEFDSLPTALSNGQIDVIAAGYTVKPDREETMDFSDSYYTAAQTIIVLKDSKITTADDLKDKVIGVQTGTTGSWNAADYTTEDKIKGFANGMLAVEALKNGQVDAVIIDNNPAKSYADENPDTLVLIENQFAAEDYALAVAKGNAVLLEKINTALAEMKADGSFDAIIAKYIK